jgi:hypothetical protein
MKNARGAVEAPTASAAECTRAIAWSKMSHVNGLQEQVTRRNGQDGERVARKHRRVGEKFGPVYLEARMAQGQATWQTHHI